MMVMVMPFYIMYCSTYVALISSLIVFNGKSVEVDVDLVLLRVCNLCFAVPEKDDNQWRLKGLRGSGPKTSTGPLFFHPFS